MTFMRRTPVGEGESLPAVLYNTQFLQKIPAGFPTLEGGRSIRAGDFLAFHSTGTNRMLVVCKSTLLAAAVGANAGSITVRDAHPFAVGDIINLDELTTEDITITAINYETNVLTVSGHSTGQASGDSVRSETAGLYAPIGIALLPKTSEDAWRDDFIGNRALVPDGGMYGDVAITGTFRVENLKNVALGDDNDVNFTAFQDTGNRSSLRDSRYVGGGVGANDGIWMIMEPSENLFTA